VSVRVGLIDYLNPGPFYWDLEARLGTDAELVRAVPAELNRALLEGRLEASIVSAYFVAQHADRLLVLPGHSVSARGAVQSVLLLSWHDSLAALAGREVAVTSSSASAVNLLRVLFEERCAEPPRLSPMAPRLDTMLAGAEAALVIGDNALREHHLRRPYLDPRGRRRRPHVFDLADEWLALTGQPFTFALWAVRRDAVTRVRALGLAEHLAASKAGGLANLEAIARCGAAELDLPPEVCLAYLQNLEFGFDAPFRAGFESFLDRAFPADARPRIELA
jgi:chorismate dehydratase